MVGSSFILINKNGRRLLFNTAQILAIKNIDVLLTGITRRHYWEIPIELDMAYVVRIEQPDGFTDLLFTDMAEREELYDKVIAAISPSAVLDSAPGLPHTWSELARMAPTSKYILEGKEYETRIEYDRALDKLLDQMAQERAEAARNSERALNEAAAARVAEAVAISRLTTPPVPKIPRKPYTRKPRE